MKQRQPVSSQFPGEHPTATIDPPSRPSARGRGHQLWQLIPVPPGAGDLALARLPGTGLGVPEASADSGAPGSRGPKQKANRSDLGDLGAEVSQIGMSGPEIDVGEFGGGAILVGKAGIVPATNGPSGAVPEGSATADNSASHQGSDNNADSNADSNAENDAGMSTVEYAVGTIVAAAFAAVLYKIVTGDSVVSGLTNLINSALHTSL